MYFNPYTDFLLFSLQACSDFFISIKMQNQTDFPDNSTFRNSLPVIIKVSVVIPVFCVFLCCIAIMWHVFACNRQHLDSSRYILFASMLINDTLQLLFSVLLFLLAMGRVKFALLYCLPLLFISSVTYQNTPLILATMSLERYVAIFYPLQCPTAWRSDRIWILVLSLWLVNTVLTIIKYSIGERDRGIGFLFRHVTCKSSIINSSPVQIMFDVVTCTVLFTVVAVVILFTYIRILLETRKLRQDRVSVSKAMHTVLLHAFQLLLCMLAFTMPITESLLVLCANWLPEDIAFFNYFCFILTPRLLSPLIYGFRDQSLMGYIWKTFFYRSN